MREAENRDSPIEFYFDFISPFAYLAHARIATLAREYNRALKYIPIDISKAKLAAGNTGPSNREIPVKLKYLMTDVARWAALDGLPVNFPASLDSYRMNVGSFFALEKNAIEAYVSTCFAKAWGEGADMASDEALLAVANSMGWPENEFLIAIDSQEFKQRFAKGSEQAHARGVFGVPTFLIGDEMWWGNDRLHFLESFLANHE
ncbi:MAG: 2-hydroxychromene-2-carboxylate isomerase [Pseudomonadota bacterium]